MAPSTTWVFCSRDDPTPPGWDPVLGLADRWRGAAADESADPVPWPVPAGAVLVATTTGDGSCVLRAATGDVLAWECDLGEDDPDTILPAVVEWSAASGLPAPDSALLRDILGQGHYSAEHGLRAVLDVLGVRVPDPAPADLPTLPPEPVRERAGVSLWGRADARIMSEVDTYADLANRVADLGDWLEHLRETLVEPALLAAGSVARADPRYANDFPAGTVYASLRTSTECGRTTETPYGDDAWDLMRTRLGELRSVAVDLRRYDQPGTHRPREATTARFEILLRHRCDDGSAPVLPTQFLLEIDQFWDRQDRATELAALARDTAVRFEAASGYVSADSVGQIGDYADTSSPFERRSGARVEPARRLDQVTRGVHWGTVMSDGHVEAVGGAAAIRESGAFAEVEELGGGAWWLKLAGDAESMEDGAVDRAAWVLRAVMPRLPTGALGLTES